MLGVYGLGIKERFIAPRRWPRCPLWARCSSLRCGNIAPLRGSAVVSLADGTVQAPGKPEKTGEKRVCSQRMGWLAVLSDECEPVSGGTVALSFMPSRARAIRQERQCGSA